MGKNRIGISCEDGYESATTALLPSRARGSADKLAEAYRHNGMSNCERADEQTEIVFRLGPYRVE
jgi:hypothetical protein